MNATWDERFEALLRRYLHLLETHVPLAPNASLTELGLDSMESIRLLIEIEDTYGLDVPDQMLRADTFATPMSLWRVVSELSADQGAEATS
jgi:acyl carrier protein